MSRLSSTSLRACGIFLCGAIEKRIAEKSAVAAWVRWVFRIALVGLPPVSTVFGLSFVLCRDVYLDVMACLIVWYLPPKIGARGKKNNGGWKEQKKETLVVTLRKGVWARWKSERNSVCGAFLLLFFWDKFGIFVWNESGCMVALIWILCGLNLTSYKTDL